jgi:hypothetical protein
MESILDERDRLKAEVDRLRNASLDCTAMVISGQECQDLHGSEGVGFWSKLGSAGMPAGLVLPLLVLQTLCLLAQSTVFWYDNKAA